MNERLVNIVKRRGGRGSVRGPTRAGWVRRDMKNGEIREGASTCARAYTRTRTAEFNVCVTAGRSRNGGGGGGGAEIYIMFIMLT